jgi:hypothetical protein
MKSKTGYNKQTKFTNQDLENIIKISQNNTNMPNMKQNEILQRSLELLYPNEDKQKLLEKMNISENYNSQSNQAKYDDFSTQPKSTKNVDYDSLNSHSVSKTTKQAERPSNSKSLVKSKIVNRSLTPKTKINNNALYLQKSKSKQNNLNKSVSLRENSKLRDSLNKSSYIFQDNGRIYC